jgi:hypothetical protein
MVGPGAAQQKIVSHLDRAAAHRQPLGKRAVRAVKFALRNRAVQEPEDEPRTGKPLRAAGLHPVRLAFFWRLAFFRLV